MVPQKDLLLGVAGVFAPFFLCGVFIVSEQAACAERRRRDTPATLLRGVGSLAGRVDGIALTRRRADAIDATASRSFLLRAVPRCQNHTTRRGPRGPRARSPVSNRGARRPARGGTPTLMPARPVWKSTSESSCRVDGAGRPKFDSTQNSTT